MSSSSRKKKGSGQGEEDKRKKSNASINIDFVQKYSQEEYSRAIPTNVLTQPKPRLGEYCVPVDSKPLLKKSSLTLEDYTQDMEVGYAQPQDSLITGNVSNASKKGKKDEDADSDDEGEVYELAKQTQEDYHVPPPQKKPSPKPRKSQVKSPQHGIKTKNPPKESSSSPSLVSKNEDDCSAAEYNLASATGFDPSHDQFPSERRRPSKKVVEIEYEVASEIRKSQPPSFIDPPSSYNPPKRASLQSFSNTNTNKDNILPGMKAAVQTQTQIYPPVPSPQVFHQSPPPSESVQKAPTVQKPTQFTQEDVYEEPWDLKAKRLKQEQEEKKQLSRKKSEVVNVYQQHQVYEEAWDTQSSQRKLDDKLKFARSFSTVSEGGEVYHDAVDEVPRPKMDPQPQEPPPLPKSPPTTNLQFPAQPTDTYEDAWDLKNKLLEERLSKIHMQATATYEEPWDNTRQQKELQDKLHRTRQVAGDKPIRVGPNLSGPVIRSTSDARDHVSQTAQESKSNYISRGRHHSIDNSNMKSKSRSGVVGQRINPSIPLINQSWFHGNITRDDAEQMLCVCREGSFIVRISSDRKSYSLSIKSVKQNIHVQIEQSAQLDGSLRYILGKNSKEFTTIPEMIDYYTQHRVPLKGAEHITLLHPVECKWSQQSS